MMRAAFALLGVTALLATQPASAKTIPIEMKNSGAGGSMVFEPAFVKAAVGDTIHFIPTNPGHNAQTIAGMLPDGVAPSAGQMSQPFDLKITKPGLYGIECKPHFSLGMVALIKAGASTSPNASAAKAVKLPPLAAKRMAPMLAAAN